MSTATVSRVLNGNYTVSLKLKNAVLEAIDELNFMPNSIARWLKSEATHLVGYIVSDISNSYFTTLASSLEDKIKDLNYNIMIFNSNKSKEKELSYLKLLMNINADGIIINTTGENDDYLAYASQTIPIVSLSRKIGSQTYTGDFIDSNNIEGGFLLTDALIAKGHSKISVINGKMNLSTGQERFEGFKYAMKKASIPIVDDYIYNGDFSEESGYAGAKYLCSLEQKPTAVITMNNSMAIGSMKYFIDHDISIPEELSFVTYGNIDDIDLMSIKPTYVTLDPVMIGNKSGELLINRINNHQLPSQQIIFEPKLIHADRIRQVF